MFDVNKVREDFSVFKNNPELIYLDSAATSLKPDIVVDSMSEYYKEYPFSINRGTYKMNMIPKKKYENSREEVAKFINASEEAIVFTRSTTTSINYLSHALEHIFEEGDEIIVSNMEHHSNFLPWQVLCKKKGLNLRVVEARNKKIEISDIKKLITSKTKLIAIHHISNVIGNEVDVELLCIEANKNNIITVIDGAQAVPHIKVDIQKINCSFYVFSGHKVLGPTGIGVMYVNSNIKNKVEPFEYGGDMVVPSSVDINTFTVKNGFSKFEAGTPSIAEVIGLGEAIKYLQTIGVENIHEHEVKLKKYALEKLDKLKNKVTIYNSEFDNGLITFNINDVSVHDAVSASFLNDITFDSAKIALRDGQHCNNLTMKYVLEEKSVLRASLYLYNTYSDIDKFVKRVEEIYDAWH